MGSAATHVGRLYKDLVRPIIFASLWSLRDKFVDIIQTLSTLAIQFLSPSGHYRASSLIRDILNTDGDLSYTNRTYASLSEYCGQYHIENLRALETRIGDFLAVN